MKFTLILLFSLVAVVSCQHHAEQDFDAQGLEELAGVYGNPYPNLGYGGYGGYDMNLGYGGGLAFAGAMAGSKKGQTTVAQPIYAQSVVVPEVINQPILRPRLITQPILQQRVIQQPILETRNVIQPIVRRIITQPIIRPQIIESTTIQPQLQQQTIVQPRLIEQTVVTPTVQEEQETNRPITAKAQIQVQQPVTAPVQNMKKSHGAALGYGGF